MLLNELSLLVTAIWLSAQGISLKTWSLLTCMWWYNLPIHLNLVFYINMLLQISIFLFWDFENFLAFKVMLVVLNINIMNTSRNCCDNNLGWCLIMKSTYKKTLAKVRSSRNNIVLEVAGPSWSADTQAFTTACPWPIPLLNIILLVWLRSTHEEKGNAIRWKHCHASLLAIPLPCLLIPCNIASP